MTEMIRVKQITPGDIVRLFFCVIDLNASRTAYKASFSFRKIYGVLKSGFPKKPVWEAHKQFISMVLR